VRKRRFPGSHITWVTRENARSLLDGNPWIDRILCVEHNYLELLLTEQFDVAIGPDTDPVSSAIMALVRANVKHGFAADERGGVIPLSDVAREWWLMGIDDARKQANRRTYGELLYAMCVLSRLSSDRASTCRTTSPRARRNACETPGGGRAGWASIQARASDGQKNGGSRRISFGSPSWWRRHTRSARSFSWGDLSNSG
jgi:hypothetical protein